MSRSKGIQTLLLKTLDHKAEQDGKHRRDMSQTAKLAAEILQLRGLLAAAREGLEAVKAHHTELNMKVARPTQNSHTIALCDAALAASTPPPSSTTQGNAKERR